VEDAQGTSVSEKKTDGILKHLFTKKMLIILAMSFSSGLPLLLIGSTLKLWLKRENIDIGVIGFFGWASLSYSLKFVWAPILDRYQLTRFGRRKSWLLLTQILLVVFIAAMGFVDPTSNLALLATFAVIVGFLSATQDIAIDAYRREYLSDEELGLGASMNIYGYRIAMLVAGGLMISLVGTTDFYFSITWSQLYWIMALFMSVGILTTLVAPEPEIQGPPPRTLRESFVDPFKEFLNRRGAYVLLAFVFLFKFGDAIGGAMLNPFYVEMGFTNANIGVIAKTFGMGSSLFGFFLGGLGVYYLGNYRSLWLFGILQILSTAAPALILYTGPQIWSLGTVVVFEDVSQAMGTAAMVAFMQTLSNRRYTATQYAILSSVASLGRNFFSGFSGSMVKMLGWEWFFYTCALIGIPGLIMLYLMNRMHTKAATT
jgi:PAT family beta-lactamase induction signal transducer AmpG